MRTTLFLFAFCGLALASCNNNAGTATTASNDTTKSQATIPLAALQSKLNDTGTQMLMSVVNKYYDLKNALVASNSDKTMNAAIELGKITDSFKASIQKDAANTASLAPYLDTVIAQSKAAASVKDESCEKQRLAFGPLSSAMYGLVKATGLKNAHIYQEYCPMAFNDKGAHWLSNDSEIKNPYFGKKMLECGEVTDVIK